MIQTESANLQNVLRQAADRIGTPHPVRDQILSLALERLESLPPRELREDDIGRAVRQAEREWGGRLREALFTA